MLMSRRRKLAATCMSVTALLLISISLKHWSEDPVTVSVRKLVDERPNGAPKNSEDTDAALSVYSSLYPRKQTEDIYKRMMKPIPQKDFVGKCEQRIEVHHDKWLISSNEML